MQIPITKRLLTAAEMIGKEKVLCDIGCDHGYLPIYLIKKEQIEAAYACDLRDGTLKKAAQNIAAFHMKEQIKTVKSDGLHELKDVSFDVISICGMGGRLIAQILEQDLAVASRAKHLVLQPMSEIPFLRKFLAEHGFQITEERLALEDRRYYVLMRIIRGIEPNTSDVDYVLGRKLLQQNDTLTNAYFAKETKRFQNILTARGGPEKSPELLPVIEELKKYAKNIT